MDLRAFDVRLDAIEDDLEAGLKCYETIYVSGTWMAQPEGDRTIYFLDGSRSGEAEAASERLREVLGRARSDLQAVVGALAFATPADMVGFEVLLLRHARVCSQITLANTLMRWAADRRLVLQGNIGVKSHVTLRSEDVALLDFPPLPRLPPRTDLAAGAGDRVAGYVTVLAEAAGGAVEQAERRRHSMRSAANLVGEPSADMNDDRSTQLSCASKEKLEAAKVQAAAFALEVARLKATRNALTALHVGSESLGGSPLDLRELVLEVDGCYQRLSSWGVEVLLYWDRWYQSERTYFVFTNRSFRTEDLLDPGAL